MALLRSGAAALRSLPAMAVRRVLSMKAKAGAVSVRGADVLQVGHGCGWSYSAIERLAENPPHC